MKKTKKTSDKKKNNTKKLEIDSELFRNQLEIFKEQIQKQNIENKEKEEKEKKLKQQIKKSFEESSKKNKPQEAKNLSEQNSLLLTQNIISPELNEVSNFNFSDILLTPKNFSLINLEETIESEDLQENTPQASINELYSSAKENYSQTSNYQNSQESRQPNQERFYTTPDTAGYSSSKQNNYENAVNFNQQEQKVEFYDENRERRLGETIKDRSENLESKALRQGKDKRPLR